MRRAGLNLSRNAFGPQSPLTLATRQGLWLWLVVGIFVRANAVAGDAALSWDSLSGEQQYTLARMRPRWETLDLAGRRALLERAATFRLLHTTRGPDATPSARGYNDDQEQAQAKDKDIDNGTAKSQTDGKGHNRAAAIRPRGQRRGGLSPAEAGMSAHSFRLRRVLREIPGLGAEERRDVLVRWGELRNSERIELVERYSHNVDDDDEMALQRALREGKIRPQDLQRGLVTGKIKGSDLKAALASGRISIEALKDGIASTDIIAEDLEKILRRGNIESSDLDETIAISRLPEGSSREEILQAATLRKAAIEALPPGAPKPTLSRPDTSSLP